MHAGIYQCHGNSSARDDDARSLVRADRDVQRGAAHAKASLAASPTSWCRTKLRPLPFTARSSRECVELSAGGETLIIGGDLIISGKSVAGWQSQGLVTEVGQVRQGGNQKARSRLLCVVLIQPLA